MVEFTERQREIIEAAIKLMDQGGIQSLTMKNIAAALGISEPAIYRHFQSKMDLLLSMLGQFKQRSGDHLRRARALEAPGLTQLETIFLEHAGQFAKNPHMTAVVFSEEAFQDDRRLSDEVFAIMQFAHATIAEIIAQAQHTGEIRDDVPKEHLALMMLGSLRLMVKQWRMSGYAFNLNEESQRVWQSLKTMFTENYKENR